MHDAHERYDAEIVVEPRVDDQRLQWFVGIALRRRHLRDELFQQFRNPDARLRADAQRLARIESDDLLDLRRDLVRFGLRQIHLVQHRNHFESLVDRRITVGDRLRFDALRSVDDEQRAFARRQRTRHLVTEVDVTGRVDEIQLITPPVERVVIQRHALRLDRDAALALDVHRVEHLLAHLAFGQTAAQLDQSIREGRFSVVDVRDDGKVSNVFD